MSATLPNLDEIAEWIQARLYITDFRPIKISEMVKFEDRLMTPDEFL